MASPQLDNGFTALANEIWDALCLHLPAGAEGRVLLCIIRKTYGWHKTEDRIPVSQIVEATHLSRRMVVYCMQNLEAKRMILVTRQRGRGHKNEINTIAFQKNYDLWLVQENGAQYKKELQRSTLRYQNRRSGVVQGIDNSALNTQNPQGSAKNDPNLVQRPVETVRFFAPSKETLQKKQKKEERVHDDLSQSSQEQISEQANPLKVESPAQCAERLAKFLEANRRMPEPGEIEGEEDV